jgi:hypothetical protein
MTLWTPTENRLLADLYPDLPTTDIEALLGRSVKQIYQRAAAMGLRKSAEYNASVNSGRIMHGRHHPAMIANQIKAGTVPWNKGLRGCTGTQAGCRATQFKKGQITGAAKNKWVPLGTLRLNADGQLERKIYDLGHGSRNWRGVHRLVWEASHGPAPKGHVIAFKPGRKTAVLEHITLDALECISRAELVRRNHPRNTSPELGRLVQLKGAITRQVNRIANQQNEGAQP